MSITIDASGKIDGAWYKASPNVGGALNAPTLIVMHYTAGGQGAADWLCRPEAQASAHVVVERDGTIRQIVPFNRVAWHAGPSNFKGRSGCNAFSIGIEIANWGPASKRGDGKFINWAGGVMDPASLMGPAQHKNGGGPKWWETYPEAQLRAVEALTRALLDRYPSITDIAGHDDVAPRNKIDPGPAFPMRRFTALLPSANRMADTSTPVPAGYVRNDDGNIVRENVGDSTIVKDSDKGGILAGAGGITAGAGVAQSMLSADWKTAIVFAVFAIVAGALAYYFLKIRKRRKRMHAEGVA